MKTHKGFTLIELIVVIAIIAILAAAIFIAIDPARRLHESRNARRLSDVTTILDSVVKYSADNEGAHYSTVAAVTAGKFVVIGTDVDDGLCAEAADAAAVCALTATGAGTAACVNLSALGDRYLATIPTDPSDGTDENTRYYLSRSAGNAITIGACGEEAEGEGGAGDTPVIELTR